MRLSTASARPGKCCAATIVRLSQARRYTRFRCPKFSHGCGGGGPPPVIDLACPNKGETLHDGLRLWHKKADGKCACDYGFHMTIDDWNETIEREIDDMYAEGISSFKMYMTYPAMMIGDEDMY